MVKLCDYFEYDLIAKVQFSKKINFENIEFYSKMPIIKVKKFVDNQDSANENFNLSSNNKIINFCSEQDDIKEKVFKPSQYENSFNKNKLSETKNKDKDIIEHNYNKISAKPDERKNSQLEDISYSEKKKSINSDKSTNQSSSKFSPHYNNEVLTKFSLFK